jgi:hypothetical protein
MPHTEHSTVVVALRMCLTRAILPAFSIRMHRRPHSLRPLDATPIVGYGHISYMTEIGLCGYKSNNFSVSCTQHPSAVGSLDRNVSVLVKSWDLKEPPGTVENETNFASIAVSKHCSNIRTFKEIPELCLWTKKYSGAALYSPAVKTTRAALKQINTHTHDYFFYNKEQFPRHMCTYNQPPT